MSSTKACLRCYRLKIKCKPIDESEGAGCLRCQSAKVTCAPREASSTSSSEHQRSGSNRDTVDKLAAKVAQLSDSIAALQERSGQNSKLWWDFDQAELFALFDHYRTTIAPGFPVVPIHDLLDMTQVMSSRPLFFRAACSVAVGSKDEVLCLALLRENCKYFYDVSFSDAPPTIDMIQALLLNSLYFPFAHPSIFKSIIGSTNLAYQTFTELLIERKNQQPTLEFERCRLAVYFFCNASRLWQMSDYRLIAWCESHEKAAAALDASDANDRTLAESVRYMNIGEGINFTSSLQFGTEDIFRQYLSLFQSTPGPTIPIPGVIDYSHVMVPLFKSMTCISLIETYLDLSKAGDSSVNVSLCFEAIIKEGQGILNHLQRLHDSTLRFPTFFYFRSLRHLLSVAYFCRTWGHTYYEELVVQARPIIEQMCINSPFILRTKIFLDSIDAWYWNYNALEPEASFSEVLDKVAVANAKS